MAYNGGHRGDDGPGESQAPTPTGLQVAAFERRGFQGKDDEELRVSLDAVEGGRAYINLRVWRFDRRSKSWWPGRAGCTIRLGEGRGVLAALAQALELANDQRTLDRLRDHNDAIRRGDRPGQGSAYRIPFRPAQAQQVRARVVPHAGGQQQPAEPPWRSAEVRQLVHRTDFDEGGQP